MKSKVCLLITYIVILNLIVGCQPSILDVQLRDRHTYTLIDTIRPTSAPVICAQLKNFKQQHKSVKHDHSFYYRITLILNDSISTLPICKVNQQTEYDSINIAEPVHFKEIQKCTIGTYRLELLKIRNKTFGKDSKILDQKELKVIFKPDPHTKNENSPKSSKLLTNIKKPKSELMILNKRYISINSDDSVYKEKPECNIPIVLKFAISASGQNNITSTTVIIDSLINLKIIGDKSFFIDNIEAGYSKVFSKIKYIIKDCTKKEFKMKLVFKVDQEIVQEKWISLYDE